MVLLIVHVCEHHFEDLMRVVLKVLSFPLPLNVCTFWKWQVKSDPDNFPDCHETAQHVRVEYVVAVEGTVQLRPKEVANARMATGSIEVVCLLLGLACCWCLLIGNSTASIMESACCPCFPCTAECVRNA